MPLVFNGTTIASNYTVSFNGTNLTAIVYNGTQVWTKGTYSLVASVFNSSGTFTVPTGVTSIVVACTGGGGGGSVTIYGGCGEDWYGGGGGSGRTSGTFSVTPGQTYSVTVGAGASSARILNGQSVGSGGTSSFGSLLTCAGGGGAWIPSLSNGEYGGSGVNGGGKGNGRSNGAATSSSCASVLTLSGGAVDTTGGLYAAKSYSPFNGVGGGGCYGSNVSNSGAGGDGISSGFSGKVVIFYYTYV